MKNNSEVNTDDGCQVSNDFIREITIFDIQNQEEHLGFILHDGTVICGCCGGVIEHDEIITDIEYLIYNYGFSNTATDCTTHVITKLHEECVNLGKIG